MQQRPFTYFLLILPGIELLKISMNPLKINASKYMNFKTLENFLIFYIKIFCLIAMATLVTILIIRIFPAESYTTTFLSLQLFCLCLCETPENIKKFL